MGDQARKLKKTFAYCVFSLEKHDFFVDEAPADEGPRIWVVFDTTAALTISDTDTLIRSYDILDYRIEQPGSLSEQQSQLISQYIPYCFLSYYARKKKRAVAVSHFAQSLDGKIATGIGDSRWIGNEANLEHAHRMRALCDGILIGKNTLRNDRPQLTVRRVEGPNPVRIVIGSRIEDCSSLVKASSDEIILFHKAATNIDEAEVRQILYREEHAFIPCAVVLERLFQEGIYSVLIEGGAKTTSRFLQENLLDILQLHLAPMILGSGRDSFQLPEILKIDAAIGFKKFFFQQVANTFMFVGQPQVERATD